MTIFTDHQPLLGIIGSNKPVLQILSPRTTRWCVKLATYDYVLKYRPGNRHQSADALSRLPVPHTEDERNPPGHILMLEGLSRPPLPAEQVAEAAAKDIVLVEVLQPMQKDTLHRLNSPEFAPYTKEAAELSTHLHCVTWGTSIVIPTRLRTDALPLVHAGHHGIVAMKTCARSYLWWPGIDADIESFVAECSVCQTHRKTPSKEPMPVCREPPTLGIQFTWTSRVLLKARPS